MAKANRECVQCSKSLEHYQQDVVSDYEHQYVIHLVCQNPECPNFGLLQTGITSKTS